MFQCALLCGRGSYKAFAFYIQQVPQVPRVPSSYVVEKKHTRLPLKRMALHRVRLPFVLV